MLVWGERHLKECLFVSVNSLKSSLKNGINIKSKALTVFFFFLLIFLGIQGMRSECCWIHEHLQRIISFSGQLHKPHALMEQFQQLPNPMTCFLMLILVFSPLRKWLLSKIYTKNFSLGHKFSLCIRWLFHLPSSKVQDTNQILGSVRTAKVNEIFWSSVILRKPRTTHWEIQLSKKL